MNSNEKITIHDIANRAHVSISTVSRVLNNNGNVRKEKRDAVLQVISDMNYKPNMFAQGLASGQSKTIGVLTQRINGPVYNAILLGILQGIEGSGYLSLFADGNWDQATELIALEKFIERKVDGLIIIGGKTKPELLKEFSEKVPLIIVGRDVPGLQDQCLRLNDFQGGYDATQYLINSGHRQIAHISGLLTHPDAGERLNGYLKALEDADIPANPDLIVDGDYNEASGTIAVEMLLMRGHVFSAIFTANDQMAYGARLALHRRGLRIPEDISIIGFDDQATSAYMIPPLSTVRFPAMEMGISAGKAILNFINKKAFDLPIFQPNLVIRESITRH